MVALSRRGLRSQARIEGQARGPAPTYDSFVLGYVLFGERFVRKTPDRTRAAPVANDQVIGSWRRGAANSTAETGTKLMNRPARGAPICRTP